MKKVREYELLLVRFMWVCLLIGFIYITMDNLFSINHVIAYHGKFQNIYWDYLYFAVASLLLIIKDRAVCRGFYDSDIVYYAAKTLGFAGVSFAIVFLGVGEWAFIAVLFPVLAASFCKGSKAGLSAVALSLVAHFLVILIHLQVFHNYTYFAVRYTHQDSMLLILLFYSMMAVFSVFCGRIHMSSMEDEHKNLKLLAELEEKYQQLAVAQEEIKYHYGKLKEANTKLEDTNKKLSDSIAEFETLQQISQAISSIFDVKELLRSVNDIILGVMGVNFSTIILFDEKKKKLKVHTTNIKAQEDLVMLNENVNCSVLNNVLINGKPIIENFVDSDEFAFARGRDINSLICVPLITKTKRYGLVLIEHKYYNAFDANNVRLLDIIGQQVGITMENAELYQKMQELANTDGLTGLYNRLYFQKTFQQEFARAVEENYRLCVAIFDIDHFKKFNDTFGHLFGDKVLKVIANVVKNSIRSSDMIARYGGEEFIITFPRTDISEAYEMLDRLRREIAQTTVRDGNVAASVTASFGLSCYPDSAGSENELLSSADYALYMAKSSGRNCIRVSKHDKFTYTSQNHIG